MKHKPVRIFSPKVADFHRWNLRLVLLTALFLAPRISTTAALFDFAKEVQSGVPDHEPAGLVSYLEVTGDWPAIAMVTVSLELTGGFNGDLYAHLSHDSGFAVLLNRAGRTATSPFGYLDAGMMVNFDDSASNGDVHLYQEHLGGIPPTGPLTGIWQPDGRTSLPTTTVATDSRTASLASFEGLDPQGLWTLVIADFDGGGETTLVRWGISVTPVPEPQFVTMVTAIVLGGAGLLLRYRRRHGTN